MNDRLAFLHSTELLATMPKPLLVQINHQLAEVALAAGEVLFQEGERGDAVYLVVDGQLRVEADGMPLMRRLRGDCVGEIALIDDEPRSAAAVAHTPVTLLRWERQDFQSTLDLAPEVARGIFKMLTGKLREEVRTSVRLEREKERWRQDLARAREIQQGMLPDGHLSTEYLEIAGMCDPAAEVGGDFFDYLRLDDDATGLVIGDVTGHGFYAGLFVAMAKSCLHTQFQLSFQPPDVMAAMRRTLDLSIQRRLLMSCCYVLFEPKQERLRYANAGHPYPYLFRAADRSIHQLDALDPILGALDAEDLTFQERSLSWQSGDVLVMYSDGITEARDAAGRMFDHHGLESCIAAHDGGDADSIKQRILSAVAEHAGERSQDDDHTLVVVRRR